MLHILYCELRGSDRWSRYGVPGWTIIHEKAGRPEFKEGIYYNECHL